MSIHIAKPDQRDFDAAFALLRLLNSIQRCELPSNDNDEPDDYFDCEDQDHLRKFYNLVMDIVEQNPSALERIIYGMDTLRYNHVFDQNDECLALHPRFIEQQTDGGL